MAHCPCSEVVRPEQRPPSPPGRPGGVEAAAWALPFLERLEDRIVPGASVPAAILSPSTTGAHDRRYRCPLSVTFSSTGDATGFGPFVDVELPTAGNVPASNNGLSFVSGSATYLGLSVQTDVLTFKAAGQVVQSLPADFQRAAGGHLRHARKTNLVVFTLPLGSFTPGQPSATIDFSTQLNSTLATLADVPLPATATGAGSVADPLNDPTTDPPSSAARRAPAT